MKKATAVEKGKFGPVPVPPVYEKARRRILTHKDGNRISYQQIANGTKIDITQVCRIFTRKRGLTLKNARRIAAYLGITVEHLANVIDIGKEEPK